MFSGTLVTNSALALSNPYNHTHSKHITMITKNQAVTKTVVTNTAPKSTELMLSNFEITCIGNFVVNLTSAPTELLL